MKRVFKRYTKKFKLFFLRILFFVKQIFSLVKILNKLNNIFLYIKDYSVESVRSFYGFLGLGIRSYFSKIKIFQVFLRIFNKFKNFILYCYIRYIMTFFFLVWILFESFFFRFYLIDTPQDSKISKDRRELSSKWWYRYLPLMIVESNLFYARPAWRIFSTFSVFVSNLRAIFYVVYVIYFEDLYKFLIKFFFFFLKSFYFLFIVLFNFFFFFFKKIFIFVIDFFYFFFIFKIVPLFKGVFFFFFYIYKLPILLMSQFFRLVFLSIPKFFLFFFIFRHNEFVSFYKLCKQKKYKKFCVNSKWVSNSFVTFLFDQIIFSLFIFAFYVHKKSSLIDFHPWFISNLFFSNLFNKIYNCFFFFFLLLRIIYFFVFSFCFFILFLAFFQPFFF